MKNKSADIIIFTDGASSGNPGPGGWGAIVAEKGRETIELGGGDRHTTNNRMELTAVIEALSQVSGIHGSVIIYTDSKYVRDGIERWLPVWQRRGWQTTAKTAVLNQDLWQKLSALTGARVGPDAIIWRLVAGHKNVPANERVDVIATAFAANLKPDLFKGLSEKYPIDFLPFAALTMADDSSLLGLDRAGQSRKSSSERSSQKAYSYISMVSGKIVIHENWESCFTRINGVSGARFKKALSVEDEKRIIADFKSL